MCALTVRTMAECSKMNAPVTSNSASCAPEDCTAAILMTDIWLVVRVPVLSEQMTAGRHGARREQTAVRELL